MREPLNMALMEDREAVWAAETLAIIMARFGIWRDDQIQKVIDVYQANYSLDERDSELEREAQQKLFEFMIAMREAAKET